MTDRTEFDRPPVTTSPDPADRDASPTPVGAAEPPERGRRDRPSMIISVVLAVVFVAALVNALQWQTIAGLFPLTVTGIGTVLSLAFLVQCLTRRREEGPTAETGAGAPIDEPTSEAGHGVVEQVEEAEDLDSVHAFFASLGRRDWLVTLGCFAAFFVVLYLTGLYVAAALFTIAYLRYQARTSWKLAIVYAVVLAAAMYGLFGAALQLPVPEGLLGLG